jgi:alanine transaminase
LTQATIPANVKDAEYAVRGKIPLRGEEIQNDIKKGNGHLYNFKSTTSLNIGNPQAVGQGHITFNREVLTGCLHPALLKSNGISDDAKARAQKYMSVLETPMGAYTSNSKGFNYVREKVA